MVSLKEQIAMGDKRVWKPVTLQVFEKAVYLWFILNLIILIPVADLIWGPDSLQLPLSNQAGLINNFFFFLNYNREFYWIILLVHGLASLLALLNLGGIVSKLAVYLSAGMLYFSGYLAFNSGFILMWLFSFFLMFHKKGAKEWLGYISSNFSYAALVAQFLIVYSVAAFWKWTGYTWVEGSAIHYTLYLDHFAIPWVRELLLPHKGLLTILTYIALGYQSLFAIMVWGKKLKYLWLMIGVGFHLYIIVMMGMYDFGSAMITGYLLFLDEEKSKKILQKISFLDLRRATR